MSASFFDSDATAHLKGKRALSRFLTKTAQSFLPEKKKIQLGYVFCSDETLIKQNVAYLQHDTYTDILTFDLSEKENELISEIHISIDRVKENARKFEVSYNNELHRVIFHGLLHLCGFNDHTDEEKAEMRRQEQNLLTLYFQEK